MDPGEAPPEQLAAHQREHGVVVDDPVHEQDRRTGGADVADEQTALGRREAVQVEAIGPMTGAADQAERVHRQMSGEPAELYRRALQYSG